MIVFPNAKINLGLSVLRKRPDGYHQIETLFYPVALSDIVEIIPSHEERTVFESRGLEIEGSAGQNTCLRAGQVMTEHFDLPPVRIFLYKKIPTGAGLGGGSSDAAFTIQALNTLFNLNASKDQLLRIAAGIGSDCPFFLENRPMLGTGRGECLEPIDLDLSGLQLILVKPAISIRTADAYAGVVPRDRRKSLKDIIQLPLPKWQEHLINDFEDGIFRKYPVIRTIKETLLDRGAIYASMTGSGSAVYGLFESRPPEPSLFPGWFVWTAKC